MRRRDDRPEYELWMMVAVTMLAVLGMLAVFAITALDIRL